MMRRRVYCFGLCVVVMVVLAVPSWAGADEEPQLCVGNYQTEEEGKAQLARFAETYSNLS